MIKVGQNILYNGFNYRVKEVNTNYALLLCIYEVMGETIVRDEMVSLDKLEDLIKNRNKRTVQKYLELRRVG